MHYSLKSHHNLKSLQHKLFPTTMIYFFKEIVCSIKALLLVILPIHKWISSLKPTASEETEAATAPNASVCPSKTLYLGQMNNRSILVEWTSIFTSEGHVPEGINTQKESLTLLFLSVQCSCGGSPTPCPHW